MICQLCQAMGIVGGFDRLADLRSHCRRHLTQIILAGINPNALEIWRKCFPDIAAFRSVPNKIDNDPISETIARVVISSMKSENVGKNDVGEGGSENRAVKNEKMVMSPEQERKPRIRQRSSKYRVASDLAKKFANGNRINCHQCSKPVSVEMTYFFNHATGHLGKLIYECRFCSQGYSRYYAVAEHIKKIHKLSATGGYIDHWERYKSDIDAQLMKCYGDDPQDAAVVDDGRGDDGSKVSGESVINIVPVIDCEREIHGESEIDSGLKVNSGNDGSNGRNRRKTKAVCNCCDGGSDQKCDGGTVKSESIAVRRGRQKKMEVEIVKTSTSCQQHPVVKKRGYDQVEMGDGLDYNCNQCEYQSSDEVLMKRHCLFYHRVPVEEVGLPNNAC